MTTQTLNPKTIADELSFRLGLQFEGFLSSQTSDTYSIKLRPKDLLVPNGFSATLSLGWRSLDCLFAFDNYAGQLLQSMSSSSSEKKALFSSMAAICHEKGMEIKLRVNETKLNPSSPLPQDSWQSFDLSATRLGIGSNLGFPDLQSAFIETTHLFLSLIMTLLPTQEAQGDEFPLFEAGLPEGAKTRIEVNKYERSAFNRSVCLAVHGAVCKACGFTFSTFYGPIGSGFIEIHHLVMVSKMGPEYIVDPLNDLIPLCSNCHSMIHRQDPPLAIKDLRDFISFQKNKNV